VTGRPPAAARGAGRAAARGALAVATVAVAGLALAACSSGPTSGTGSTTTGRTTTTGRSTTTSTPSTTAPPTSSTTSTTGSPGLATCLATQLAMVPQNGNGAAGTIYQTVVMTNSSSTTCTLYGYPGMQLLDAQGGDIPTTVVRGGLGGGAPAGATQPATLVTLAPGQAAAFAMQFEDVQVGNETSCPTSAKAEITPPNDTAPGVVAMAIGPCDNGTVHVSPVFATG
jgi:hypothetical protein